MSGKAVGWAMEQVTGSPVTKLVLLKLADNANDLHEAFPSLNKIVEHTELSKRTVIDHLDRLETLGLIRIQRSEEDGQHLRNRYFLNMPLVEKPGREKTVRSAHHKNSVPPQPVVEASDPPVNVSSVEPSGGGVAATPPMQDAHEGGEAPAVGVVSLLHGGGVADANPPAPPIEINPQTNPQVEPPQNAGAREAAPVAEAKPEPAIPPAMRRYPADFESFRAAWPRDGEGPEEIYAVWRAQQRLLPPIEQMLEAVELYKSGTAAENATRPPDNQRPWCNAATWLKNRRWEGYLAKAARDAEIARNQPAQVAPWGAHPAAEKLLKDLGEGYFDAWFRPCVLSINEGVPMLTTPSRLIRDRLVSHHMDQLETVFGGPVVLQ